MQEQLALHLEGAAAPGQAEVSQFEAEIDDLAGIVPVQLLLLRARVDFTQCTEQALMAGTLPAALANARRLRSAVIARLRGPMPEARRRGLTALQTLLQEQQHTLGDLALAEAQGGRYAQHFWRGEMRFYETGTGRFECRCNGKAVAVRAEQLDPESETVLVTTEVTKWIRRGFFNAMFGGPGVLLCHGVAGTGKTETIKDIASALGLAAAVVDGSNDLPDDATFWQPIAERAGVIIIDEACRASASALEAAVCSAKAANVPLCLTFNPGSPAQIVDVEHLMRGRSVAVKAELPHLPLVVSSMLGAEGLQEADDLGDRLTSTFEAMKARLSKQPHYDFGMRQIKSVVRHAGAVLHGEGWPNERQAVTTAVQQSLLPAVSPSDEGQLRTCLAEHFGAESCVPLRFPGDFWNNAAGKISATLARRHAGVCLPVMPSEENFVVAVAEEEAQRAGAELVVMPGTMAGLPEEDLYGAAEAGGWRDGELTRAVRRTVAEGPPRWLLVFCGDLRRDSAGKWENLNTLLDDNKALRLGSGESLKLRPSDRVLFAARSLEHASPATVSRLGVINLEAQHRNRM